MVAEHPGKGLMGNKRQIGEVVLVCRAKKPKVEKARVKRSTESMDAVKLEVLREMHALYVSEVEKECVLPSVSKVSKYLASKLLDDPRRELKKS